MRWEASFKNVAPYMTVVIKAIGSSAVVGFRMEIANYRHRATTNKIPNTRQSQLDLGHDGKLSIWNKNTDFQLLDLLP